MPMFENISVTNIFWTMVNLLVLLLLLKKFLFGPVTRIMEARQKAIEDAIAAAAEKNRAADDRLGGCDAKMRDADRQAAQIVAEAHTRGQRAYDEMLRRAQVDAGRRLEEARAQIELERVQMQAGVRAELSELVLLAAARLAQRRPDPQADQALVEAFLSEAGDGL